MQQYDMASHPTATKHLRKLHLSSLLQYQNIQIHLKKLLKYSSFQLHICEMLDFSFRL